MQSINLPRKTAWPTEDKVGKKLIAMIQPLPRCRASPKADVQEQKFKYIYNMSGLLPDHRLPQRYAKKEFVQCAVNRSQNDQSKK
jgi:hypothetical protein